MRVSDEDTDHYSSESLLPAAMAHNNHGVPIIPNGFFDDPSDQEESEEEESDGTNYYLSSDYDPSDDEDDLPYLTQARYFHHVLLKVSRIIQRSRLHRMIVSIGTHNTKMLNAMEPSVPWFPQNSKWLQWEGVFMRMSKKAMCRPVYSGAVLWPEARCRWMALTCGSRNFIIQHGWMAFKIPWSRHRHAEESAELRQKVVAFIATVKVHSVGLSKDQIELVCYGLAAQQRGLPAA